MDNASAAILYLLESGNRILFRPTQQTKIMTIASRINPNIPRTRAPRSTHAWAYGIMGLLFISTYALRHIRLLSNHPPENQIDRLHETSEETHKQLKEKIAIIFLLISSIDKTNNEINSLAFKQMMNKNSEGNNQQIYHLSLTMGLKIISIMNMVKKKNASATS